MEKYPEESRKAKKGKRVSFSFGKTFEDSGSGGVLYENESGSSSS